MEVRAGTTELAALSGVGQQLPQLGRAFLLFSVAFLGFPGTLGFVAEATDAALADPEAALTCYRAIANERGIVVGRTDARQSSAQSARQSAQQSARESAKQSAHESAQKSAARNCSTCRHRKRPGRADPGYCGGGRDDLPAAYGLHHPLRKLPADQGASCASYRPHED